MTTTTTVPDLPEGAQARYDALARQLSPAARIWTTQEAARLKASRRPVRKLELRDAARWRFSRGGIIAEGDVESLIFIVMMQAAKDAQGDLKAMLEELRRAQESKAALKSVGTKKTSTVELAPRGITATAARISAAARPATGPTTAPTTAPGPGMGPTAPAPTGDLSAEMQSRLQKYMDAYSQTAALISEVMEKSSDSSSRILQNLK